MGLGVSGLEDGACMRAYVEKSHFFRPPLCRNRWWFSLGILVSFTGVLGATSALRYQGYNKPSTELVKPAGGVQLLGVLTGEI